jgi:hypothetical protein
MIPPLTVPPEPHSALNFFAKLFKSFSFNSKPLIKVTPLPLRPLVSRDNLMMPSECAGNLGAFSHRHFARALPHFLQLLPPEVEYTSREFELIS